MYLYAGGNQLGTAYAAPSDSSQNSSRTTDNIDKNVNNSSNNPNSNHVLSPPNDVKSSANNAPIPRECVPNNSELPIVKYISDILTAVDNQEVSQEDYKGYDKYHLYNLFVYTQSK